MFMRSVSSFSFATAYLDGLVAFASHDHQFAATAATLLNRWLETHGDLVMVAPEPEDAIAPVLMPANELLALQRLRFVLTADDGVLGMPLMHRIPKILPVLDMINGVKDEKLKGNWHGDPRYSRTLSQTIIVENADAVPAASVLCSASVRQFSEELMAADGRLDRVLPETSEWFQCEHRVTLLSSPNASLPEVADQLKAAGVPHVFVTPDTGSRVIAVSPAIDPAWLLQTYGLAELQ